MKLAAMEGLYDGTKSAPLVAIGILNPDKNIHNEEPPYLFEFSIPYALSYLAGHDFNAFVPGINDLLKDFPEKQAKGKLAIQSLQAYTEAKNAGDTANAAIHKKTLEENFNYFGYGYLEKPEDAVPNVPIVFYAFRIMVILGSFFIAFFLINLWLTKKQQYPQWWLMLTILSVPLIYICSQSGWIVAEVGRQPWTIQDLLPVNAAISGNEVSNVITTILVFFSLFTVLLIAELKIMFKIIKQGPETIE